MFPAFRPNFAEVSSPYQKAQQHVWFGTHLISNRTKQLFLTYKINAFYDANPWQIKDTLVTVWTYEGTRGSAGAAPHFLKFDPKMKIEDSSTPRNRLLFLQGKSPRYPLNRWLHGCQCPSRTFVEGNYLLPLTAIKSRFIGRPARSLVPVLINEH